MKYEERVMDKGTNATSKRWFSLLLVGCLFTAPCLAVVGVGLHTQSWLLVPATEYVEVQMPPDARIRSGKHALLVFDLPVRDSVPAILEVDRTNAAWFVMGGGGFAGITYPTLNFVGRLKVSGELTVYSLPTEEALPSGIRLSEDGRVFVTEYRANQIAVLTVTENKVHEYTILTPDSRPTGLDLDPQGNLWFNENLGGKLGRLSEHGVITETVIPTPRSRPTGLVIDHAGVVWFAEMSANKIGARKKNGVITEYAIPTPQAKPTGLAVDSEGRIWFSERGGNKIGLVENGEIREFPLPTPESGPFFLVDGGDGAMWFTELYGSRIGRIDKKTGDVHEIQLPFQDSWPAGIGFDADGNLWVTMQMANKVAVILSKTK